MRKIFDVKMPGVKTLLSNTSIFEDLKVSLTQSMILRRFKIGSRPYLSNLKTQKILLRMDIDALFREIEGIDIERKRLREEMRKLNESRNLYLEKLVQAADERGVDTLSYKGREYTLVEKVLHTRKPEKDRRRDVVDTLSNYIEDGDNLESVYTEVTAALKGEQKVKKVIKNLKF